MIPFSEPYLGLPFPGNAGGLLSEIKTCTKSMEMERSINGCPCSWECHVSRGRLFTHARRARDACQVKPRVMPARTLETLVSAIPKAFEQAQNSSANHQKNL